MLIYDHIYQWVRQSLPQGQLYVFYVIYIYIYNIHSQADIPVFKNTDSLQVQLSSPNLPPTPHPPNRYKAFLSSVLLSSHTFVIIRIVLACSWQVVTAAPVPTGMNCTVMDCLSTNMTDSAWMSSDFACADTYPDEADYTWRWVIFSYMRTSLCAVLCISH